MMRRVVQLRLSHRLGPLPVVSATKNSLAVCRPENGSALADPIAETTRAARRRRSPVPWLRSLPDHAHDFSRFLTIHLGVNLGHGGAHVAQDHPGSVEAELLSQERGGVVP